MKIQGNTSHSAHAYGQIKRQQQAQTEQNQVAKPSAGTEAETSIQATSSEQLKTGEANGVIRHLQEGHYQGVAQLRLSIVHAERFQQVASQQTSEVLDTEGERLTSSLHAYLNESGQVDSGDALVSLDVESAMNAFEEALASGREGSEGGQLSTENFEELYSNAFQALVEYLEPVLSQSGNDIVQSLPGDTGEVDEAIENTEEGGTQPPVQVATEQEPEQTAGTVYLAGLEEWFSGELMTSVETIQEQVAASSAPPLPSQPPGNGTAYEKFLAVYQELYGVTEQQPDTPPQGETDSIETEA